MIKGMTGFGSDQLSTGKVKAIVEIKSLNHRYFDISYYLPIGFGSIENKIRQLILKHVKRGRVTLSIKITQKPMQSVQLNKDAVRQHLKYANQIKKEFGIKNDMSLSDLMRLPGIYESKETLVNPNQIWSSLEKSIKKAVVSLENMRKREGKSLAADVNSQLRQMSVQSKKIQARHKTLLRENKKRLTAEEFASYQKGCDINEEISRLQHYLTELKTYLKSTSSIGKKIDFIAQEMQRETNTIGSKVQDKVVSNAVITLKSKIEKIREQAQNIE